MRKSTGILLLVVLNVTLAGCVLIFRKSTVERVEPRSVASSTAPVSVPIKAYLTNGDILILEQGAQFTETTMEGWGYRYALESIATPTKRGEEQAAPVAAAFVEHRIPLDSLEAVETYRVETKEGLSIGVSLLATSALVIGVPLLYKALFGSCPTTYSEGETGPVLEAESFSNSIVPLFERRDVDRLRVTADGNGQVRLEVRNEALETHYINHVELLAVGHASEVLATTTPEGEIVLLGDHTAPPVATSRAGADVSAVLAGPDERAYRTADATLDRVSAADLLDYIDLSLPHPGTDSAAVVLRLRNSLLTTVFFYEFILGRQGAEALNWLGRDLNDLPTVVAMGDFYQRRMGLRVSVREAGGYREVGRVPEVGPIAWNEVAVPVAAPPGDSLHLRLSFVADAWRIDQVAVASRIARTSVDRLPLQRVEDARGVPSEGIRERLADADEAYVVTYPGQRFSIMFTTPPLAAGETQTFFLAAQGYYTEWVRGQWIREAAREGRDTFRATDETLAAAIDRWRVVHEDYEAHFETTKIPVR